MTSIRVGNRKIKSNILIGSVIVAMIAPMVTTKLAISNNTAAKAQDLM